MNQLDPLWDQNPDRIITLMSGSEGHSNDPVWVEQVVTALGDLGKRGDLK